MSRFNLAYEYNERDYEVIMQAAADRRREKREEIKRSIAIYLASILPRLKLSRLK